MLVDFSVCNFGPFRDKATFSMQGTSIKEHPEMLSGVESVSGDILRSAFIFGANASGKSYLVKAFVALKEMVRDAFAAGHRYRWYEPFRLRKESLESPVGFRIRMIVDGILYDYSISYGSDSVMEESLHRYPHGRRACVFQRTGPDEYRRCNEGFAKFTTTSSAYLAVASKYNDEVCARVRTAILDMIVLNMRADMLMEPSCDMAAHDPICKERMLDGLKIADFGISDFIRQGEEADLSDLRKDIPPALYEILAKDKGALMRTKTLVKHDFDEYDVDDDGTAFPIEIESAGTRCMLGMMGPLVDALINGKTLIVDEFGSYFHPLLVRWIIDQFSADGNPNKAQLIVVTHNVELMDIDVLRRDQVWFTDKDCKDGSSRIYSLSDFKGVRKDSDIRKSYLIGRFDAIPEILPRNVIQ